MHNAIHVIKGKQYHVRQARLSEMVPHADTEQYGNPLLWWVTDMESHDLIVPGVKTMTEAMAKIEQEA